MKNNLRSLGQTLAATRTSGRAASATPFFASPWLRSSSETQPAISLWSPGDATPAAPLTHLVEDVEVPLVDRLAGHPGLLQQIRLHRRSHQQLTPSGKNRAQKRLNHPRRYYSVQMCEHLSSWSWMYFPKRLLLLFLSVQALPASEPSINQTTAAKLALTEPPFPHQRLP